MNASASKPPAGSDLPSRLEVLPFASAEEQLASLPAGTTVTVTVSPKHGIDHTLAFAERWAGQGLDVVPHLTARMVTGRDHVEEIARRIGCAGFGEIFVIGGDRTPPLGPYASAAELLDVLRPRLDEGVRIGIAGYPEGHPAITDAVLAEALGQKADHASTIVTQLCFDGATVAAWIRSIRAQGVTLPVLVGVPGVVDRRKLLELATRVGVGASTRFLRKNLRASAKLLVHSTYEPTGLVEEIGAAALADPSLDVAGFHLFTFNQIAATGAWLTGRHAPAG